MTVNNDVEIANTVSDDDEEDSAWFSNRSSIRYRIVYQLSRLTRGSIRSPYHRYVEAFHKRKDFKENAESRSLPSQRFSTWAFWAVEAYTPANIAGFLSGLEKLKPVRSGSDRNPAEWLRKQRYNPGSSLELYFAKPGTKFPMGFEVEMPEFASIVTGTIKTITPSLTLVTMLFVLKDDERQRFDTILHADHPTRVEPYSVHGTRIFHPELERRRLVREARGDWSNQASNWIACHMPGLFTANGKALPTCELTVVEGLHPFPTEGRDRRGGAILSALHWNDAYPFIPRDPAEEGLFYVPSHYDEDAETSHSLIALTREAYERRKADGWGSGEDRFLYPLDNTFRPVITQWAVSRVLDLYRRKISAARDGLVNMVGGLSATRAIGRVRQSTAECADAATIAREIGDGIADHSLWLDHAGLALRRRNEDDEERRLDVALRETMSWKANGLMRDVSELNGTLHAQAALLSAHANLRLQPWIIILAVVSTLAGGLAAIGPARELLGLQAQAVSTAHPAIDPNKVAPKRLGSKGQARPLGRGIEGERKFPRLGVSGSRHAP